MVYSQCNKCHHSNTPKGSDKCVDCGAEDYTRDKLPESTVYIDCFKSGYFEHIGPKPIRIRNRDHLRAECKEHGVTSHYLN